MIAVASKANCQAKKLEALIRKELASASDVLERQYQLTKFRHLVADKVADKDILIPSFPLVTRETVLGILARFDPEQGSTSDVRSQDVSRIEHCVKQQRCTTSKCIPSCMFNDGRDKFMLSCTCRHLYGSSKCQVAMEETPLSLSQPFFSNAQSDVLVPSTCDFGLHASPSIPFI